MWLGAAATIADELRAARRKEPVEVTGLHIMMLARCSHASSLGVGRFETEAHSRDGFLALPY
jgi:hypothetical protein